MSQKSEKPTAKKLADARRQGTVAKSVDLTGAAVTMSILGVMSWYGPQTVNQLGRFMKSTLAHPVLIGTPEAFVSVLVNTIVQLVVIAAPFVLAPCLVGIAINLFQVKPLLTLTPIKPAFNKLNPLEGAKRLVSRRALIQFAKSLLKMLVVAGIAFSVFNGQLSILMGVGKMGLFNGLGTIFNAIISLAFNVTLLLLVLGAIDWFYQKYELTQSLMMTKQEVKDEIRNMEGNPEVKNKIRSQGRSMANKQMLAQVPMADVVLINPTHYSVALQYDPDVCPAPRVIAKGTDHMAFKIREIAKANRIPLHEDPPLARSLHAQVEIYHMIPPELFMAVAEVLAVVFQKKGGRKPKATNPVATALPLAAHLRM
jgi:flagellar biosynthesis protein FlhB